MKRFLVVLLSLGIVAAFSASAFAVTADFSGSYWAMGWYSSNPKDVDQDKVANSPSSAFVNQRLRLFWNFKVADGLALTVRSDIREDVWRTSGEEEPQVAFDHTYIDFNTGIGRFRVGNQASLITWGTDFLNSSSSRAGIRYTNKFGPVDVRASWQSQKQNAVYGEPWYVPQSDADSDIYAIQTAYKNKEQGWEAGLGYKFARDASKRTSSGGYTMSLHAFEPYVIAKFGQLDLEAEGYYLFEGDARKQDDPTKSDIKAEGEAIYLNAKYNMGPAYFGARFQYVSGDKPGTSSKKEGGFVNALGGGTSGDPTLHMFQGDWVDVMGSWKSVDGKGSFDDVQDNMIMYQGYVGYALTPKIDLYASYSYFEADQKPTTKWIDKEIGSELDVTFTYKIFDQLTYEIAAIYFWTGDWFKGEAKNGQIDDNYILRNMIQLSF